MDCYEKGQNYATADNSYVIFFCCFDPFGFGDQEYQIERLIKGHPDTAYVDGEQTLVFDVTSLRQEVNPKLQQFLDVIANRQVGDDDDFIVQLEKRITFVKQNRKWRREYMQRSLYEMDIENSIALAKEQGLSQGKAEERTRGIHNLIYSLERLGTPKATIKQNLMELYQLSSKEAEFFLTDK
ncbi:hypothetical protein [Limosilactobacillus caccae]|uniref:hypothetical protein n=1 Tax=Limosilactobacillus caccae TaxID=1926284 RepID=UPI0009708F79|nr:hypothetical protein [Limosilactobacillus caccae]